MEKVACSILKADFLNLSKTLDQLHKNDIKWIHYDIMDNHFVPNLSFGPGILKQIADNYDFFFDLHFMVKIEGDVEDYLTPYLNKNVKQITVHIEALTEEQIDKVFDFCKENEIDFSLAVNPDTNIEQIFKWLHLVNNVLLMSVQPGFGGQKYNPIVSDKIIRLLEKKNEFVSEYKIQIDGGVTYENIRSILASGVNWVVAGSLLTDNLDVIEDILDGIE